VLKNLLRRAEKSICRRAAGSEGFGFGAVSGSSCCLASVSLLPCWLELLQHLGHLGLVAAVRPNSPKGVRDPPCPSPGYGQDHLNAESSQPPSSFPSSTWCQCWKNREKYQMLQKSWPHWYAACICFVLTL